MAVVAGLGLSVHTGWAAAVVASGGWDAPVLHAREHVELMSERDRFVFHQAAEMSLDRARAWIERARREATERARAVLDRLAADLDVRACIVVAKTAPMLALEDALAAHPRIHTAEGAFYRDVLKAAAEAAGMRAAVVAPKQLDAKDPRLAQVGKLVGKPWSADWKLATLAAWRARPGAPR